jgi:uncharacterized membrane protein
VGTPPGAYPFSVSAQTHAALSLAAQAAGQGVVQVTGQGVQVEIVPNPAELPPGDTGTWQVHLTNTGLQAGTFDLSAFGPLAAFATFSQGQVSLNPGASQTVMLVVGPLPFTLPQEYLLGVTAQSHANAAIRDEDTTQVAVKPAAAVLAAWQPASLVVKGVQQASFSLWITNTGNTDAVYQVAVSASPQAQVTLERTSVTLPAGQSAVLLVTVKAGAGGVYHLTALVTGADVQAQATASLQIGSTLTVWLPIAWRASP